jgi:ABC-type nitrate/sulfonate/bicarbonate transport system ATPase subunit
VLSASPAHAVDEIVVPFERPRREDLWTDPRFNELKARIYGHLQGGSKEAGVHGGSLG